MIYSTGIIFYWIHDIFKLDKFLVWLGTTSETCTCNLAKQHSRPQNLFLGSYTDPKVSQKKSDVRLNFRGMWNDEKTYFHLMKRCSHWKHVVFGLTAASVTCWGRWYRTHCTSNLLHNVEDTVTLRICITVKIKKNETSWKGLVNTTSSSGCRHRGRQLEPGALK